MNRRRFFPLVAAVLMGLAAPAFAQGPQMATAVFAGGCFWTVEYKFERMPGVTSAVSGYSGGDEANPTYEDVYMGRTSHVEAVQVTYDPARISYQRLVDSFWRMIDPTDEAGQACDLGETYLTSIFYASETERDLALASRKTVDDGPRRGKIVTSIRQAKTFWPAEAEHQDFARLNPADYEEYARGCGREEILAKIWADKARL